MRGIFKTGVILIVCMLPMYFAGCGKSNPAKTYTIGIVTSVSIHSKVVDGFKSGMTKLGYIEGQNIRYIYNGAVANDEKAIDAEISTLLSQKVDLLLPIANEAALRAQKVVDGSDTPILFSACALPVKFGLVKSITHPGANITGVETAESNVKTLELLKDIIPELKKVYVPYNPDDEISVTNISVLDQFTSKLGIDVVFGKVKSAEEVIAAIEALPKDVNAIYIIPSPTFNQRTKDLNEAAIKRGIPIGSRVQADNSVLLTYAPDLFQIGNQTARLAHQILIGEKPSELPVETAEVYLTVNLKTAERLGIHVPNSILMQAATVIH